MKNKLLVIVSVPVLGQEFEMYIPTVKKVGIIKNTIIKVIEEESGGAFKNDGYKSLYDKASGERIHDEVFVKNSVIRNGSKLILY